MKVYPTFLGIGAPRSGSTWLHNVLDSHPDIYVPQRRKEVRFFNEFYNEGPEWYAQFFPEDSSQYRAVGEVSPQYLNCKACADRIAALENRPKLIAILRHPVDRAYSRYGHAVRKSNYTGSFEQFIEDKPGSVRRGYYVPSFERYLQHFDRSQMLILLFEEATVNVAVAHAHLANFLDVDVAGFSAQVAAKKAHASYVSRYPKLYGAATRTARKLRGNPSTERVVDWLQTNGADRVFGKQAALPALDPDVRTQMSTRYYDDMRQLSVLFDLDLSRWGI